VTLAGCRVLVTRAAHQAGKLSEGLRALGAVPVEVPVLEIRPPESLAALDGALQRLDSYGWLILTSANTVRALAERAVALDVSLGGFTSLKVAAVGASTAAAAEKAGLAVALIPESYVAEGLVEILATQASGHKILLARAAVSRDVIPDALRAAGARSMWWTRIGTPCRSARPHSYARRWSRESTQPLLPARPA